MTSFRSSATYGGVEASEARPRRTLEHENNRRASGTIRKSGASSRSQSDSGGLACRFVPPRCTLRVGFR